MMWMHQAYQACICAMIRPSAMASWTVLCCCAAVCRQGYGTPTIPTSTCTAAGTWTPVTNGCFKGRQHAPAAFAGDDERRTTHVLSQISTRQECVCVCGGGGTKGSSSRTVFHGQLRCLLGVHGGSSSGSCHTPQASCCWGVWCDTSASCTVSQSKEDCRLLQA